MLVVLQLSGGAQWPPGAGHRDPASPWFPISPGLSLAQEGPTRPPSFPSSPAQCLLVRLTPSEERARYPALRMWRATIARTVAVGGSCQEAGQAGQGPPLALAGSLAEPARMEANPLVQIMAFIFQFVHVWWWKAGEGEKERVTWNDLCLSSTQTQRWLSTNDEYKVEGDRSEESRFTGTRGSNPTFCVLGTWSSPQDSSSPFTLSP